MMSSGLVLRYILTLGKQVSVSVTSPEVKVTCGETNARTKYRNRIKSCHA